MIVFPSAKAAAIEMMGISSIIFGIISPESLLLLILIV